MNYNGNTFGCSRYQLMVERRLEGPLSSSEERELSAHALKCEECRDAIAFFEGVEDSFAVDADHGLQPEPGIQQMLRRRVAQRRVVKKSKTYGQHLAALVAWLFELRIPAYQAALASAAVVMLLFFANVPPVETADPTAESAGIVQVVSMDTTMNLIDSLSARSMQTVGRTLKDDSLLARFITPLWRSDL